VAVVNTKEMTPIGSLAGAKARRFRSDTEVGQYAEEDCYE
jgi:hypothetical protein